MDMDFQFTTLTGRSKRLNEAFQDEAHIIYVNSRKQDDTELGRLMHDLHCKKADEMHSPVLAKRVHELKETQKGVELMCHEMEKIYSEGMESGEKRGKSSKKQKKQLFLWQKREWTLRRLLVWLR